MSAKTNQTNAEKAQQESELSRSTGRPIQAASANDVRTPLGNMTLSMFEKGQYVRVRVGALHNATELYEHAYDSADEANAALLEAGILTKAQIPDPLKVAGTGIELKEVTAEQLEEAGLKRHLSSSL